MLYEEKAQGSTEMLLILAGAIMIAAIVGYFLKTIFMKQANPTVRSATHQVEGGI